MALTLTEAVRTGAPPAALPTAGALGAAVRGRLAAELEPGLRAALGGPAAEPAHPAGLLRVASVLGVDVSDLLPGTARQLALALLTDPERAYGAGVRAALAELPGLRALVLDRLDSLAAGDPAAGRRLFERTALRPTAADARPHLRMCAEAAAPAAPAPDRVGALNALLARSGVSLYAEPLVLRTAMRLVWDGDPPGAGEAGLVLMATGSQVHREAGTWELLVQAAVRAPAGDTEAAELAPELLGQFQEEIPARLRPSLLLLELALNLRSGPAGGGWVRQALDLGSLDPEPGPRESAYAALCARLLAGDRPDSELRALIESNDAELLAAYRAAARTPAVRDRLRLDPGYAADCFTVWSSQPQAGPAWQEARTDLLDGVLRPAVRGLAAAELAELEQSLARLGGRWADEFRTWQRPGAFARLRERFAGRRSGGAGNEADVTDPELIARILAALTGVIGVAVCLGYGLWRFLALALSAAWAAFRTHPPGGTDPRITPYTGPEPARPAYWAGQMWLDARFAGQAAALTVWFLLTRHWLGEVVRRRLLRGRGGRTGELAENGFGRLLLRLLAPGTALAALLSALLASVLLAGVALFFAVELLLVALAALAATLAGRAAERLWKLVLGIRMKCPYPGCYRPFPLAVHLCPGCGAAHRELRPGAFGALRHVCRCGKALPSTLMTGRRGLAARCPHCDRGLPPAVGTTRVVHVPLIGGTSAGKTMLLAAVLDGLRSWSHESRLTVEYASPTISARPTPWGSS